MTDLAQRALAWRLELIRQAQGLDPLYWDIPAMRSEGI